MLIVHVGWEAGFSNPHEKDLITRIFKTAIVHFLEVQPWASGRT
jgi:hypothetical protein